jgi:aminoglycoside phosphotransferase (APT) family kinase protein
MTGLATRNASQTAVVLAMWLSAQLPDARDVSVTDVEQSSAGGYSNEPLFFTASWTDDLGPHRRELVTRLQAPGVALFPNPDLRREFLPLKALGRTPVPLPRVYWLEEDPAILGAPFMTMERVAGRIPPDNPPYTAAGWVLELSAEEQATLYDNGLRAIAAISGTDWRALGIECLDRPLDGITTSEERVEFAAGYFEWAAEGRSVPTLEAALEWVRTNCPASDEPLVVSWGDARIGNMVFGENLEVVAVLDWEQAVLGSPELDLGWWLFSRRTHGEGLGLELPPGFPSREATIARFEELTGHEVRHADFYEAYNGLLGSIAVMRLGDKLVEAGALPADSPMPMVNPAVVALAGMLGLPAPTGTVTSWATKT